MTPEAIIVEAITPDDIEEWLAMRQELWPEDSEAGHREEVRRYFSELPPEWPGVVFFARDEDGKVLGFAELSVRPYAEGCSSYRVAYLEGWFVIADARRQGVGKRLIEAGEAWGMEQGCTEFASDAEVDNEVSRRAHGAVGFADVGTVRCFSKKL